MYLQIKPYAVSKFVQQLHLNSRSSKNVRVYGKSRLCAKQQQEQRAKADAEGRDHRGLHKAGSGTCHNALVSSVARAHWDATEPVRHSWDARKKAKAGKVPKKIVLASEGYTPPLAAYEQKKTT